MAAVSSLDLLSISQTSERLKDLADTAFVRQLKLTKNCYQIDKSAAGLQLVSTLDHFSIIETFGQYINSVRFTDYNENSDDDENFDDDEFSDVDGMPTMDIEYLVEDLITYAFQTPNEKSTLIIDIIGGFPLMTSALKTNV